MYEEFFGMTHTPFIRGIPVDSLYADAETDEVHDRLLYTAKEQLFAILAADAGMGKTTVLRRLRNSHNESEYTMLYLADSKMTPRSFYNDLLEQLGCQRKFLRNDARRSLHHEIEIMRGVGQHKLVVVVDESHLLPKDMFEEIRFLLNYKMDSENPLALILVGQTELWSKLKTQAYRAVMHRVDIKCFLQPYDLSQTKAYILTQLDYSGFKGSIFSEDAMQLIYDYSSGVPRLINNVCANSLIYAYQNRRTIIDDRMVQQVIEGET